ncbi:MAG: DUF1573 domain-containing protein [Bacteroidia bacterium]
MLLVKHSLLFVFALSLLVSCGDEGHNQAAAASETVIPVVQNEPVIEEEPQDLAVLDTGKVVEEMKEELKAKVVAPTKRAKAQVASPDFDFGFIDEGAKIKHTFIVKNGGNASLKIKDVESACGCTVAKLSQWEVAPGKSTKVETVFDSDGKFGKQRKEIVLTTTGGRVVLALIGVVRPKGFKKDSIN